ncbi:MAG: Unknown protein [uncultured Sulfurovum sp.]|uniref:Uncharacterized protein n=1 Tax=uncultured Sulfurovum sp. TaxID=269237 RepID=A0A6S6U6R7_9BACT|nr:MAG: Unknown protein [uncultured Sulfurovum sp.]
MTFFVMGMFTGCPLDDDNNNSSGTTQFKSDVQSVLAQNEDAEPLEITDTFDDSTSFDSLL